MDANVVAQPVKQDAVAAVRAVLAALGPDGARDPHKVRSAMATRGLLGVDAPVEAGGLGLGLLDAMAVALEWGETLSRPVTTALLDGAPVRVLMLRDRLQPLLRQVLAGQANAALLDGMSCGVKLERRPGGAARLIGDVPPTAAVGDAASLLVLFEDRVDWPGLAVVSPHHASLRQEALGGLPMVALRGLLDTEVQDADLLSDAPAEVLRALAAEELVRACRTVGETQALLLRVMQQGAGDAFLVEQAQDRVLVARTALLGAASRLVEGGPHTLLGEEARLVGQGAALEARAVVLQCVANCASLETSLLEGLGPWDEQDLERLLGAQVDRAALVPWEAQCGVWFRLGETRSGPVTGGRVRSSNTTRPPPSQDSESRAPHAHRPATGRVAAVGWEPGPLPHVPPEAKSAQWEARGFLADHPAASTGFHLPLPEAITTTLGERGLATLLGHPEQGGGGAPVAALLSGVEELSRAHGGVNARLLGSSGSVTWALSSLASAEARMLHLPPILAGTHLAALALHPVQVKTVDGVTRLHGVAQACGAAGTTHILAALHEAGQVDALALVALDTAQVLSQPAGAQGPMRVQASWDGVELPPDAILLKGEAVRHALERLLCLERLIQSARCAGILAHVLEGWRAALHARGESTRVQDARRLGGWWARLACMRALQLSLTPQLDGSQPPPTDGSLALLRTCLHGLGEACSAAIMATGVEALAGTHRLHHHAMQARVLQAVLSGC